MKKTDKNLKTKGKARLTSMLKSGKALEIFSVRERDLAKFARGAKLNGIVYCVLRKTKNSPDGLCDIMVKTDDAPKISRLIERFQFATVDKAKIESEIVAEKAGRSEGAQSVKKTGADTKAPDTRVVPDVGDTEKLLDDLLGVNEGKAEPETPPKPPEATKAEPVKPGKEPEKTPPFARNAPTPTSPQSEPTSGCRKKPESPFSRKPSVREELREITAKQKKRKAYEPKRLNTDKTKKSPKSAMHNQQPRSGKRKKSKGGRLHMNNA